MIYLDNAATTGHKPIQVVRAAEAALKHYSANPGRSGHALSERTAMAVFSAREKAAEFFGAEGPEQVVFTSGCTHSINCVIKGVLHPGDHVIVSSLEHNAVIRPIVKSGLAYDIAQVSLYDDNVTLENFRRLIRSDTRMIFVTGASNVIGRMLPITALGRLCRERGLFFGVDAAQIAGVIPIDMRRDNIDFLCIAPHKGLYAPMGVGILIARRPIENTLIEGGTGVDSRSPYQPESMPERMESGTVNVPGIMGVSAGLDFVKQKGTERIFRHELQLVDMLYDGLEKMPNIELYTPRPDTRYAPVISFNIVDVPSSKTADFLNTNGIATRAGLHCAPSAHKVIGTLESGTVRVCPSVFNTGQEIQQLLFVLKKVKNL